VRDFEAISILGGGAITLGAAWAIVRRLVPSPVAIPNERSLHQSPVPRAGGIAIWMGWSLAAAFAGFPALWALPLLAVLAVSLVDDWRGLAPAVRLAVHAGAAFAVVVPYGDATTVLGWAGIVVDALVVVWMANLYNFMDGADGLAGTMGVIGFLAYALAAAMAGVEGLAMLAAALAVCCAAFLAFNLPPARLFMGDVGAVGLGFMAAVMGRHGIDAGAWPWWLPPLVFLPFILDATLTLLRRWRRGAALGTAHREHFYQRSILTSGSHGRTLAIYAMWMVLCAAIAVVAARFLESAGGWLLLATAIGFGIHCGMIERRFVARRPSLPAG
jgi:UDP-N-acetylmuramyl pentapeptide phosphotransferase/UDP-N-acetylglucosamine-1-phosphate transferase